MNILVHYKLGKLVKEINDELILVYQDVTLRKWINQFKQGIKDLKDKDYPRAPIKAPTPQNIEIIQQLINNEPHISLHQLKAQTSLFYGTIKMIIKNHLYLRKLESHWVPYQNKKQSM